MLTAKEAYDQLKEVRQIEKDKDEKKLIEMEHHELVNVEKDIKEAIALSKPNTIYTFIARERIIQMRVWLTLKQLGYTVDFIDGSSSIVIGWIDISAIKDFINKQ